MLRTFAACVAAAVVGCAGGCALDPLVVTVPAASGKTDHFYLSNTLCAVAINPRSRFGVFFREEGTSPREGRFSFWIFNLDRERLNVPPISVRYYTGSLQSAPMTLDAGEKRAGGELRLVFDMDGDTRRISYAFALPEGPVQGTTDLKRERRETYLSAVHGCSVPASAEALTELATTLRD